MLVSLTGRQTVFLIAANSLLQIIMLVSSSIQLKRQPVEKESVSGFRQVAAPEFFGSHMIAGRNTFSFNNFVDGQEKYIQV